MGSGRRTIAALQALLPDLWTFALRLASTPEDAEKLLDNVCHGIEAGTYDCAPYMSLRVNVMSTMLRRWQQKVRRPEACAARAAARIEANSETSRRLLQVVAMLPDEQRIAIILIEAERLTPSEAAWAWGLTTDELERRLVRAHAAVNAALENGRPPLRASHQPTRRTACPLAEAGAAFTRP
ncbi:RNA polymerase sigma factor [Paraburkholderia sp. 2C]|jgi:RNA polymerase sigma-70 factor, ECF subfamily